MRSLRYTAIIAAMMCLISAASCGHTKGSSSKADDAPAGETTASGEAQTDAAGSEAASQESDEEKENRIYESVKDAQISTDAPSLGTAGEVVAPDEDDEEAKLGNYCVCDDGVKLYYDESVYPKELALTLKEYFKSFAAGSFTDYTKCVYPSYITGMDAYLQKEYKYDIKRSFSKQCVNLLKMAEGDYTITRIKIEPHGTAKKEEMAAMPEEQQQNVTENDPEKNIANFFANYEDALGKDYADKVRKETDKLYDMDFYIMVKVGDDSEKLILGSYEIIFAEKDGRFYTFG